jgi:hypothetical protein
MLMKLMIMDVVVVIKRMYWLQIIFALLHPSVFTRFVIQAMQTPKRLKNMDPGHLARVVLFLSIIPLLLLLLRTLREVA